MQTFLKLSKIKTSYIFLSLIIFLLLSTKAIYAQDEGKRKSELPFNTDATINLFRSLNIPAYQVAYYKGDNIVFQLSNGFRNQDTKQAINHNTAFQAASLTKVVATYVFLRLMDRGLISLDKPLWEYYPYDRLINHPNKDKITARMVLTHRTGLLNWEGDVPTEEWRETPLTQQFIPGTDYRYSGEGFYFLQETMEHITKKSFQELVEQEVLIPFEMKDSEIVWKDRLEQNAAFGHFKDMKPRKLGKYLKSNAAYTLYTTAKDYTNFLEKVIFEGKGLKAETHKLFLEKAGEVKKDKNTSADDQHVPIALGLRMQINEVGTSYWHTGSNPGFRCYFVAYPKTKEILTVFTNSENGFSSMPGILALFLNNNQTFWLYTWRQGELD